MKKLISGIKKNIANIIKIQLRNVFIQTLETPNPNSLKFYPTGKKLLEKEETVFFESPLEAYQRYAIINKKSIGKIII